MSARPGGVSVTLVERPRDFLAQLRDDVRAGLTSSPKRLPPKYFYDARGSRLFEEITRLPEYYQTRTETRLLEATADAIVAMVRPEELVEIGSGSSRKTQLLLEAMERHRTGKLYVPLDVSEAALRDAAHSLHAMYPWLEVHGVVGDFEHDLARVPRAGRRLVAFLGSTIGNLDVAERARFFATITQMLQGGDRFLLGVDLVKDVARLEAAYNDSAGVTDEFNLNVLHVVNRELGADIPVDAFEHLAFYDVEQARIEMHLRATRPVVANVPGAELTVRFDEGELLMTEISCKFTREGVERELAAAGLALERWDTDEGALFGLALARPA